MRVSVVSRRARAARRRLSPNNSRVWLCARASPDWITFVASDTASWKRFFLHSSSTSRSLLDFFASSGNHLCKCPCRITLVFSSPLTASPHSLHLKSSRRCKHLLQYVCPQLTVTGSPKKQWQFGQSNTSSSPGLGRLWSERAPGPSAFLLKLRRIQFTKVLSCSGRAGPYRLATENQ